MKNLPPFEARLETSDGYGTLAVRLTGSHKAEADFQAITEHMLTTSIIPVRITETLPETAQSRLYHVEPRKDADA